MKKCRQLKVNIKLEIKTRFYIVISIAPSSSAIAIDGPIHVEQAPIRVRHYFVFSLFSALCLCPATGNKQNARILFYLIFFFQGLIALAYSLKSSAKADVKFHDKARLYSRRALLWNLVSVIFAVFSLILVLIFAS
jgi:hypothetical protein